MKRRYIVISSFFVAVLLLGFFCYASMGYTRKISGKAAKRTGQEPYIALAVSNANQKTNSETRCIIEIFNADTEELVCEERAMPAEYAGMTREQLEESLLYSKNHMELDEKEAGLTDIRLVRFSKSEVVIRKTYEEPEQEEGYYLRLTDDGEVAIYHSDGKTLFEETGIRKENLPAEEVRRLENGYAVKNEKELYSILENFSS